jgi:hypothetical protein
MLHRHQSADQDFFPEPGNLVHCPLNVDFEFLT